MRKIGLLNGPNLNMLGTREPEIYGSRSLDDIVADLRTYAGERGAALRDHQSNVEGQLVDAIQEAMTWADGIVFNPGGYTHTSVALRDAIAGCGIPVVETHMSNVYAREEFRSRSLLSGVCLGVISGFGATSYKLAIDALIDHLEK
jgi:3-dehydroquinate dehydratase-2